MSRIVMKFGGTSVRDVVRIRQVAGRVARVRREGHEVVAVVSAMAGDTDRLIRLAQEITPDPSDRELDMLLSSGERITSALLAMALSEDGIPSRSFSGRQVGIHTDSTHTKARIEHIDGSRLERAMADGLVPVVAGFQGISPSEDVTTLGRGGSDTTAVALAVAISADRCDIYTDVTGVFTADPNMVPRAKKLEKISYEEMLEMAALGAKVLHSRSVEFAMRYRMPLRVLSTFSEDPGTYVTEEDRTMEQMVVSGVTLDRNQAQVVVCDVPDRPGLAATLFRELSDNALIVDMIVQNVGQDHLTDISFTVPRSEARKTLRIAGEVASRIGAGEVKSREDISKISIVGVGMRSHSGVAARMFETLAGEGINILMISTSEIKISCLIDEKYGELAARVIHSSFGLDKSDAGEPSRG
ncbi:MAG: aspartate kinase [Leptospirales bacterium]